jgi:hypothetical protein
MSSIDAQQWAYEDLGNEYRFRSKLSRHVWNISKTCVTKFLESLDVASVNEVMTVSLNEIRCTCFTVGKENCQNLFNRDQVMSLRGQWWENYPHSVMWASSFLKPHNTELIEEYKHFQGEKRVFIKYVILSHPVCRTFYSVILGLGKKPLDAIARCVLGNTKEPSRKIVPKIMKTPKIVLKMDMSDAFWFDFFSTCQSPVEGLRLFPANQSRLSIYCNFFVDWWDVVYGGLKDETPLEVPVGVDRQLYAEVMWEEEKKEYSHMSEGNILDCNSADFLDRLSDSIAGKPLPVQPVQMALEVQREGQLVGPLEVHNNTDFDEESEGNTELVQRTIKSLNLPKEMPSFSTFCTARWSEQHRDVKSRAKHHHCRCRDCALIESKMLKAFQSAEDRTEWKRLSREHNAEVRRWRTFENQLQSISKFSPETVVLLSFDDTSAFGLPRFSNRSIKNMSNVHVNVIPFNLTNHGTGEHVYIYTLKGKYLKGANRQCTSLYHTIRRIKFKDVALCTSAELKQRNARKLVLASDNAADNKNNVIFAFCSHLIWLGWYDEIEMYFGPVGHTHNGNDGIHFIHNQIAGNNNAVTLAEFFRGFYNAWDSDRTRPQPIILDTQYDFEEMYRPHMQQISYYSRSHTNESYVRAFRFHRTTDTRIEMLCKGSPSAKEWCGVKGVENGPGFMILQALPQNAPSVVRPQDCTLSKTMLGSLSGKGIRSFCQETGFAKSLEWLLDLATTGHIPTNGCVPLEVQSKHPHQMGWGQVETIGVQGKTYDLPIIRPPPRVQTGREFWSLPTDLDSQPHHIHVPFQSESKVMCPPVDYKRTAKRKTVHFRRNVNEDSDKSSSEQEDSDKSGSVSDEDIRSDVAPSFDGVPTKWGANFDHCVPNSYAVIQTEYDGNHAGVAVIQVVLFTYIPLSMYVCVHFLYGFGCPSIALPSALPQISWVKLLR